MHLTTLFVDMNAYFASAEQQRDARLRHKPVAVAAVDVDSSCCIAASYEAKRFGVKTGTGVREAKRMCPGLHVVRADPMHYVRVHHQIIEAVNTCLPVRAVLSIDEMACRLSPAERDRRPALEMARRVKEAIYQRVGAYMRCSIGLAPNRLLAKVAADMRKPDGVTALMPADLPGALYGLELTDLPGIGPRMNARLHAHGIRTVERLCRAPVEELRAVWGGVTGAWFWHGLHGTDVEPPPTHRRTVGHSHVLPPARRTAAGARAVLIRLISKAGVRLRHLGYWAGAMEVSVGLSFQSRGWRAVIPLGVCQDTLTMVQAFAAAWDAGWGAGPGGAGGPGGGASEWAAGGDDVRPTKVAVTLFRLVADRSATRPLFPAEQARVRLARVMDHLNAKYGPHAVYFGGMHDARDAAPTRIAFTQIPDLSLDLDGEGAME